MIKEKRLGLQIKGQLVKVIGNVFYFQKVEEMTIDTKEYNTLFLKKDLLKIVEGI